MRVYRCPDHPEKSYSSWRKFRGHWSTRHRGEEVGPREQYLEEIEKEEFLGEKKEYKEELGEKAAVKEEVTRAVERGEFTLPEDPVPRLDMILEVHGVDESLRHQILGVFQIHPGYQNNPVNLHYLLTAKLPRKLHPSIPMIISAFTAQEGGYPEGIPMMGGVGGMGPGAMPPYMMGGGYQPMPYLPVGGYYMPRQPMGRYEDMEEGRSTRRRESPMDSMKETIALMGALFKAVGETTGGGGERFEKFTERLEAAYTGLSETIEEVLDRSKEEKENVERKMSEQLREVQETSRAVIEETKESLHRVQLESKEAEIARLQEEREEERTEGLGELLREAGEGITQQAEGIRETVTRGVDRVGDLAESITQQAAAPKVEGGIEITRRTKEPKMSLSEASDLLELESEVERIAKELEGGRK